MEVISLRDRELILRMGVKIAFKKFNTCGIVRVFRLIGLLRIFRLTN
jgi:hypothetical protein